MLPPFRIHRPAELEEAIQLLRDLGPDAVPYAGGTELVQTMKLRLADPRHLIDLKQISELRGIVSNEKGLRIGATTTHAEINRSATVHQYAPALSEMAAGIGNIRIRTAGTVGGNLVFAEPHSDPATLLLAAGAAIELAGLGRQRTVPIEEFVVGAFESSRDADELLVSVVLPPFPDTAALGYARLAWFERPAVTVGVRVNVDGTGRLQGSRIAVGSVGERPRLLPEAASLLDGAPPGRPADSVAGAGRAAATECEPVDDLNGSVAFKRQLVAVSVERAITSALGRLPTRPA